MKKTLKQAINDQLETVSLDEEQLDKLVRMQQESVQTNHSESQESKSSPSLSSSPLSPLSPSRWYAATAAVILALLSFVMFSHYSHKQNMHVVEAKPSSQTDLIQKIANEVAENHLEMKPMEVQTGEIDSVQRYFTKLGFLPLHSQQVASNTQITLAGGRYCSIQGTTAAQLRYKDQSGGYVTLFEAPYDEQLFDNLPHIDRGDKPLITYARGIKVSLWAERGLLMVSTEKPE